MYVDQGVCICNSFKKTKKKKNRKRERKKERKEKKQRKKQRNVETKRLRSLFKLYFLLVGTASNHAYLTHLVE